MGGKKNYSAECPVSVSRHLPVDTFQYLIVLSQELLTMKSESVGENATLDTL